MEQEELIKLRLQQHNLSRESNLTPEQVVSSLGAVQAQDYPSSLWAMGIRAKSGTLIGDVVNDIEEARIVRSWLNRGTIHFSHSIDVKWLLDLFRPGLLKVGKARDSHLGLTEKQVLDVEDLFRKLLSDKNILTRSTIYEALNKSGLAETNGNMGYHLLYRAAWDGIICFGPQVGREQTFTLLENWISSSQEVSDAEALSNLTIRYFSGHGPSTLKDFAWWSGLKISQCRTAINAVSDSLEKVEVDSVEYYILKGTELKDVTAAAHLLPAFDEYLVGYSDRSLVLDGLPKENIVQKNGTFRPVILVDGIVAGNWSSKERKGEILISADFYRKVDSHTVDLLKEASTEYGDFMGKEVELVL